MLSAAWQMLGHTQPYLKRVLIHFTGILSGKNLWTKKNDIYYSILN